MTNLEELYCCVDDFCQQFIPLWHQQLIVNEVGYFFTHPPDRVRKCSINKVDT
ncbi:hypothetical protein [Photorhabdus luminescens]|uniref:hypothetical protein n=1 Tax=Photorhabdus luminescens TaxID=29488 RepID=UPI0018641D98|nr:hypothetical protein [Photorhabdus luminescens]